LPSANQIYFDSVIRHQMGLRRFSEGEAQAILLLLQRADRDLVRQLRERLARIGDVRDFTGIRLRLLLTDIRRLRRTTMQEIRQQLTPSLVELSSFEVEREERLLAAAIPIEVQFAAVSAPQIRAIVFKRPFQGRLLREWYQTLEAADRVNLTQAVQLGLAQGESIPQIVRRVAGTRAKNFTDGALAITRRQAESVVRTAVNHVSNAAREALWAANEDIIAGLRWTATLDGRTTKICASRDGKIAPIAGKPIPRGQERLVPPGARPPAHVNCRSVMVAWLDGVGMLGDRPFVTDIRTRRRREIDFRRMAREQGRPIQEIRREWAEANIGKLPSRTTYDQFLRRSSKSFQDDYLGITKGRLFRRGKLDLDDFVDVRGREFSLEELAQTKPEAFARAGLRAEDFD